jgi:hypothetical protein
MLITLVTALKGSDASNRLTRLFVTVIGLKETRGFYSTTVLRIKGFDASFTHFASCKILHHVIYSFKFIITLRQRYLLCNIFIRFYFMARQP